MQLNNVCKSYPLTLARNPAFDSDGSADANAFQQNGFCNCDAMSKPPIARNVISLLARGPWHVPCERSPTVWLCARPQAARKAIPLDGAVVQSSLIDMVYLMGKPLGRPRANPGQTPMIFGQTPARSVSWAAHVLHRITQSQSGIPTK